MKKLLTIVFLMATSLMAKAQYSAVPGYCTLGATPALISGLPSLNTLQGIVPGCTVTVLLSGTQTPATIFASAGGQALGNPFVAVVKGLPNAGSYLFYAASGTPVDIVLSGGTAPNVYQTPVPVTGVNPGGGGSVAGVSQVIAGTGVSVSPSGGTGAVTVSATGGSSTPSGAVTSLGASTGSSVFGDSTACGTGATATTVGGVYMSVGQNAYPGLLKSIVGGDQTNDCYPATTETDINNFTFFHADNQGVGSPTFFGEGFINDATNANATSANYQASQKYGLQAQVLFRALPRANKTFAQDGSITTTGTWVSDTGYQPAWGISSTTNGSTFSCPATIGADGHGIVWALIKDGNGGTWTGSWSGTGGGAMTDPVTSSSTFNATGYGGVAMAGLTFNSQYVAYIVSGLSAGAHTFTGTVTSTTGAGNVVDFGGCAGLPAANTNLPWDFEAGVPYQNSGIGGAADSTTAAYNTIVSGLVTTLSALPLNVGFVDVRNSLLNATACGNGVEATMFTNCYSDSKHLNNLGYSTEVIQPATGYAAVVTTANPALALGGLKNPRLGPMFEYPNLPAPKDTSRWYNFNATNNGHGYGAIFNCANGGQNCDGIGDLQNYGLSLVMGGNNFNLINQTGSTVTPTNTSTATQFITATPSGALCFFGTNRNCNGNPITYFANDTADIGGLPGYQQAGSWLTSVTSGVATQTAAVSGTNQNSFPFRFRGTYWNGTANQPADVYLFNAVGSGTTPTSMLTLGGQYAGTFGVDFSTAAQQNKYGSGLLSALQLGGITGTTQCLQASTTGVVSGTGSACGSGSSGLSGMTAGQVPVAATATTVTSSIAIAGGGTALTSGPTTSTTNDVAVFSNTTGQISDSGKPMVASGTVNGQVVIWNASAYGPVAMSGAGTLSGTGVLALTAAGIQSPLAALGSCTTGTAYSPFSGTCIAVGSVAHYFTATTFTGIGPTTFTPTHTLDIQDTTATTGNTLVVVTPGAGQSTDLLDVGTASIDQFSRLNLANKVFKVGGQTLYGAYGTNVILQDTSNAIATTLTTAQGSSSSPIVVGLTNIGSSAYQKFILTCFMRTVTAVSGSSVNLYITYTDDLGVQTDGPYALSGSTAGARVKFQDAILAKTVPFVSTTNIGYYTTITGSPQYGLDCTNLQGID